MLDDVAAALRAPEATLATVTRQEAELRAVFRAFRDDEQAHLEAAVERDAHKAMIIGNKGSKLKQISTEARLDMEKLFDGKVYLEVWVKVRSGWTEDAAMLQRLGYD